MNRSTPPNLETEVRTKAFKADAIGGDGRASETSAVFERIINITIRHVTRLRRAARFESRFHSQPARGGFNFTFSCQTDRIIPPSRVPANPQRSRQGSCANKAGHPQSKIWNGVRSGALDADAVILPFRLN